MQDRERQAAAAAPAGAANFCAQLFGKRLEAVVRGVGARDGAEEVRAESNAQMRSPLPRLAPCRVGCVGCVCHPLPRPAALSRPSGTRPLVSRVPSLATGGFEEPAAPQDQSMGEGLAQRRVRAPSATGLRRRSRLSPARVAPAACELPAHAGVHQSLPGCRVGQMGWVAVWQSDARLGCQVCGCCCCTKPKGPCLASPPLLRSPCLCPLSLLRPNP